MSDQNESAKNGRSSERTDNSLEVPDQDCGVLTCRGRRVLGSGPESQDDDRRVKSCTGHSSCLSEKTSQEAHMLKQGSSS